MSHPSCLYRLGRALYPRAIVPTGNETWPYRTTCAVDLSVPRALLRHVRHDVDLTPAGVPMLVKPAQSIVSVRFAYAFNGPSVPRFLRRLIPRAVMEAMLAPSLHHDAIYQLGRLDFFAPPLAVSWWLAWFARLVQGVAQFFRDARARSIADWCWRINCRAELDARKIRWAAAWSWALWLGVRFGGWRAWRRT